MDSFIGHHYARRHKGEKREGEKGAMGVATDKEVADTSR